MLRTNPGGFAEPPLKFEEQLKESLPISNVLPLYKSDADRLPRSVTDEALVKKMTGPALLRIKAMDYTIEIVNRSAAITAERIQEIYDTIYKNLNGTNQRQKVR